MLWLTCQSEFTPVRSVRRIPLSRRSRIIGFQALHPSGVTEHESALERDFVTLTTFRDASVRIVAQPITLGFLEGSRSRRYTPDFLVYWCDGTSELVEVKYRDDLKKQWSRLRPAFITARAWAQERGTVFRIATERAIRGPLLENARCLLPLRAASLDHGLADQLSAAFHSLLDPTFGALVASVHHDRATVLGTLWRMIAQDELHADVSVPIGFDTRLILR